MSVLPVTRSDKVKTFTEDGEKIGLKKETITKLCEQDIDTVDILRLCSSSDVDDFQLSKGQSLVLQQWIDHLNTDDIASLPDASRGTIDPIPTSKPLLVVDHINCVVGGISDAPEHQVYSQGGTQLFFRSSRQKPSPDHVTLAQWVGANACILQELIRKGTIQSLDDVDTYLQYNIIFSDYAQVNELPSVLVYDHEFCRKQHAQSRPWDQDDFHLANFHLRRKEHSSRNQAPQHRQRYSTETRDAQGLEICRNFNGTGCDRPVCRYAHACLICRARGHSSAAHNNSPALRPQAPPFAPRPL